MSTACPPSLGLHREPPDKTKRGRPSKIVTVVLTLLDGGKMRELLAKEGL